MYKYDFFQGPETFLKNSSSCLNGSTRKGGCLIYMHGNDCARQASPNHSHVGKEPKNSLTCGLQSIRICLGWLCFTNKPYLDRSIQVKFKSVFITWYWRNLCNSILISWKKCYFCCPYSVMGVILRKLQIFTKGQHEIRLGFLSYGKVIVPSESANVSRNLYALTI